MKEMFMGFLENSAFDSLLVWLSGIISAFIVGKALPQFKWQMKKLESKYRQLTPDWLEPTLDKMARKAQETIIKELLKEAKGLENELSTDLKLQLKNVVDTAIDTTRERLENKAKDEIIEKASELTKIISDDLLEKVKIELVNTPAYNLPALKDSVDNANVISIIDRLKELPKDKNHIYQVYAELQKKDNKEVEGIVGANITGRI